VETTDITSINANNNALALLTTTNNTPGNNPLSLSSGYRPATVAQLISNNPVNIGEGDLMEETVSMSPIEARSCCKIQIQNEYELQPGQINWVIMLQATSQEQLIYHRRGMIENMVQDRILVVAAAVVAAAVVVAAAALEGIVVRKTSRSVKPCWWPAVRWSKSKCWMQTKVLTTTWRLVARRLGVWWLALYRFLVPGRVLREGGEGKG
jgi:hypothetical protein